MNFANNSNSNDEHSESFGGTTYGAYENHSSYRSYGSEEAYGGNIPFGAFGANVDYGVGDLFDDNDVYSFATH